MSDSRFLHRALLLGTLLATSAITACTSVDEDGSCTRGAAPCDIRDATCQLRVYEATACMREQEPEAIPPVRVITPEEFESELREMVADAPPEDYDTWGAALGLLRLIEPSGDLLEAQIQTLVEQVAAFYQPSEQSVTIIDRGDPTDTPEDDLFVLSHEFTHALQDQAVGLGPFQDRFGTTTDSDAAISSLIEGEATFIGSAVLIESIGVGPPEEYPWDPYADRLLVDVLFAEVDATADPLIVATELGPYAIGLQMVSDVWLAGGQPAVNALYEAPPLSIAEVLATPDGSTEKVDMACYPTAPPAGYVGLDDDSLGILGPFSLLSRGDPAASAWLASFDWRDDRIVISVPDGGDPTQVAVAWRVKWATTDSALAFASDAGELLPDAIVTRSGAEVLIQTATDPAVLVGWTDAGCGTEADLPGAADEGPTTTALRRGVLPGRVRGRLAP